MAWRDHARAFYDWTGGEMWARGSSRRGNYDFDIRQDLTTMNVQHTRGTWGVGDPCRDRWFGVQCDAQLQVATSAPSLC